MTGMRWVQAVGAAFVVMHAALPIAAAERAHLKEAFKVGQIELTLTAKDEGATLELKIKNRSKNKLLLVIPKGKTPFDVYNSKILLVAAEAKNVDLLADGETTLSFPMEQSGGGRWTSGSVTQSVTPPSPPKQ